MRTVLIAFLTASALVLGACGTDDGDGVAVPAGDAPVLEVVAAFYPLAEAAERVGGDRVAVTNLTPAGVDPHDLELTPSDRELIEDADVVILMGRGFQPALERAAGQRAEGVVELLRELPVPQEGEVAEHHHGEPGDGDDHGHGHDVDDHGHSHDVDDHGHGHDVDDHGHSHDGDDHGHGDDGGPAPLDPHVWLDPTMMALIVEAVADALTEADPDGEAAYREGAEAYRAELEALDQRFEEGLARCERRLIVTAHEAFGWLADRYGLEQVGIAGINPEIEPSPQRMAELVELVQARGVTTVFHEVLVSPRVAETLAREAGVDVALLNPIEGLTSEQEAAGATYVSVMEENLAVLREALGCS